MSQSFTPKYGAMGAGIGAGFGPAGAAIGAGAGLGIDALSSIFGSDAADEENQRRLALLQQLFDKYGNPSGGEQEQLDALAQRAKGGLTPEDKAAFLEAMTQANTFARGREGAIEQRMRASGGGVANSGQSAVLQAQAAQDAAQRLNHAQTAQAGIASQRGLQAQLAYLQQMQRNRELAMNAGGMLAGGYGQSMDYHGAKDAANNYAWQNAAGTAAGLGMYYGQQKKQRPAGYESNPAQAFGYGDSGKLVG